MQLTTLDSYLEENRRLVDAGIEGFLESYVWKVPLLKKAASYSLAGGKRLRGVALLSVFEGLSKLGDSATAKNSEASKKGERPRCKAIAFAVAIEMIHAYSLIHDDLPCMDDDDYRRGRPSCHRKFGEAVALLSGDALLTIAFESMLACRGFSGDRVLEAILEIAKAAGPNGMVGGQVLDLLPQKSIHIRPTDPGRISAEIERPRLSGSSYESIRNMYEMKTGAMFECAAKAGAILAGASDMDIRSMASWGRWFGYAYQILDDIDDKDAGGEEEMKNTLLKIKTLRQVCLEAQDALMKSLAFAQDTGHAPFFVEHLSCFYLSRVSQTLRSL